MAPVPVHTSSPISTNFLANPSMTSPSTAAARYTPFHSDADASLSPTTTASAEPSRAAQPGAPAMPRPTNTAAATHNSRLEPTPTEPLQADPTQSDSPPPPQPGAVPTPRNSPSGRPSVPPPPRPLEIPTRTSSSATPMRTSGVSPTPTHARPLPIQSSTVFTPTRSIPAAGVTSTYPVDLSHPPGYMQDHRASFDDKPIEFCQPVGTRASPSSSIRRGGGILDSEPVLESPNGTESNESNVLNTAMAWAKAAGRKLSETERQIWNRINGDEES